MKARRQRAILDLVHREPLATQAAILGRLREEGFDVTQSTVSRDLDELGLTRIRDAAGRHRYAPPEAAAPMARPDRLRRTLEEFVVSMQASGNLVVIHTPPGAAQTVARALDEAELDDAIGTVAGDDTIMVVAAEGVPGRLLLSRLEALTAREAG